MRTTIPTLGCNVLKGHQPPHQGRETSKGRWNSMSREIKEEMVMPMVNTIRTSLHYQSQESDLQGPMGHLIGWGTGLQRRSEHIQGVHKPRR